MSEFEQVIKRIHVSRPALIRVVTYLLAELRTGRPNLLSSPVSSLSSLRPPSIDKMMTITASTAAVDDPCPPRWTTLQAETVNHPFSGHPDHLDQPPHTTENRMQKGDESEEGLAALTCDRADEHRLQ